MTIQQELHMSDGVPRKEQLWQGAVLGGVVNAIMSAESDLFGNFIQWIQNDYLCDGMDGREGVVVFQHGWHDQDGWLVGLFFSAESELGPYRSRTYDLNRFLHGMPPHQRALADLAIEHYLMEEDAGRRIPEVTAAFWSLDNEVTANSPWADVLLNGANLIENELLGFSDEALARWQRSYGMEEDQVALVIDLFRQRIAQPAAEIHLPGHYTPRFRRRITDERSLRVCLRLLSAISTVTVLSIGLSPPRRELTGGFIPMVDARFFRAA